MLEAHKLFVFSVLFQLLSYLFQPFFSIFIRLEGVFVGCHILVVGSQYVDNVELEVFFLQKQILVLRMYIHKLVAQFAH